MHRQLSLSGGEHRGEPEHIGVDSLSRLSGGEKPFDHWAKPGRQSLSRLSGGEHNRPCEGYRNCDLSAAYPAGNKMIEAYKLHVISLSRLSGGEHRQLTV